MKLNKKVILMGSGIAALIFINIFVFSWLRNNRKPPETTSPATQPTTAAPSTVAPASPVTSEPFTSSAAPTTTVPTPTTTPVTTAPIDARSREIIAMIEKDIIGTWEGTLDEYALGRVINRYVFKEDGTYEYSEYYESDDEVPDYFKRKDKEYPYNEAGTFILTHDLKSGSSYHSTLTLTHDSETTVKPFALYWDTPMEMSINYPDSPTYKKQ